LISIRPCAAMSVAPCGAPRRFAHYGSGANRVASSKPRLFTLLRT
jgi:hypothetical protein